MREGRKRDELKGVEGKVTGSKERGRDEEEVDGQGGGKE